MAKNLWHIQFCFFSMKPDPEQTSQIWPSWRAVLTTSPAPSHWKSMVLCEHRAWDITTHVGIWLAAMDDKTKPYLETQLLGHIKPAILWSPTTYWLIKLPELTENSWAGWRKHCLSAILFAEFKPDWTGFRKVAKNSCHCLQMFAKHKRRNYLKNSGYEQTWMQHSQ